MGKSKHDKPPMLPHVIKAARAALGWTQHDLAACTGCGKSAIASYEGDVKPRIQTYWKLRGAFENNGIEFITEGNRIVGIRWK
jgi:transcriptional regulator with XRE-family HTH domain